jgi:threonine synthase
LYIPCQFPIITAAGYYLLKNKTMHELGFTILSKYLSEIPDDNLKKIIVDALSFPIPLILLEDNIYLLEVFHGPTLAFKDVGARFMANILAYFAAAENRHINIIVATSGDTGSAIASAFHHMPNVDVFILYPSGKVSRLQEQQITTFGGNIHALEVTGTFDDCQRLVKTALSDSALQKKINLTTANSINIARLLPQIIYHAWGLIQLQNDGVDDLPVISVPSGNLGNLMSAVYAHMMGFSVKYLIAAMNINTVFVDFLDTLEFKAKPSQKSLANAMDVGNPSNIERIQNLYSHRPEQIRKDIKGYSISDKEIIDEIRYTYDETGYILDPHTAVGTAAARKPGNIDTPTIVTATAHPAKFPEVIKQAIDIDIELPERLQVVLDKPKQSVKIAPDYDVLKKVLEG